MGLFILGAALRVSAFIDGFNLYHAIDDLRRQELKWLDLRKLCKHFAPSPEYDLGAVYYFSAYATWRPDAYIRHREYVNALQAIGVTPIMGKFKTKTRVCRACGHNWTDHEEKETDVNIATYILKEGFCNSYDQAALISADSDLAPAVRLIKSEFPEKQVKIIIPVGRGYSWDLVNAAGGKKNARRIKPYHLERSLLPELVRSSDGKIKAKRPYKYRP